MARLMVSRNWRLMADLSKFATRFANRSSMADVLCRWADTAPASATGSPAGTRYVSGGESGNSSRIAAESRVLTGRPAAQIWKTLVGIKRADLDRKSVV